MALRNRRLPSRSDYTLLENTDSDADSVRRRSISSQITNQSSISLLCDKCWSRHERNQASKRCLDCKQNLCTLCARSDEASRPWWLPSWLVQCWRFIFTKAYIPHSIVDLQPTENERPHWAHTQEASHIQRIPRVSGSSLRSNQSASSKHSDKLKRPKPKLSSSLPKQNEKEEFINSSNSEFRNKRVRHSQSFDAKPRKRLINERRPRRTRSTDELVPRHRRDDLDRLKRYNQNWEDFENSFSDPTSRQRMHSNKMRGKDVNIEITDDKEIKLTVNCSDENTKDKLKRHSVKCAIPKCKGKRKSKDNTPQPYTEEIFKEVPIWFKKSKHSFKEQPGNKRNSQELPRETSKQHRKTCSLDGRPEHLEKHAEDKRSVSMEKQQNKRWYSYESPNVNSSNIGLNGSDNRNSDMNPNVFKQDKNLKNTETLFGKQNTAYIVEEPPDACPICLEDLPEREARALACCHVIHTKCLITYLHKMDLDFGIRCPLCAQTTLIRNYYVPKERWYMELPVSTAV